jgi:hypothetical protein
LPWLSEVPLSGFGYPRSGVSLSGSRNPISDSNALELRPSELCSSLVINPLFQEGLSALALPYKTVSGLTPGLQRLPPTGEAVPFNATQRISLGQGRLLSWAL